MSFLRNPVLGLALIVLLPTAWFAWSRRSAGRLRLLVASATFYLGLVGLLLILGHLFFVGSIPLRAEPGGWSYDFRFYGMMLFGVLVLWACASALRCAAGLARGERRAARRAALAALAVLALNAPLLPIQPFAVPLTAGAALSLAVLALTAAPGFRS